MKEIFSKTQKMFQELVSEEAFENDKLKNDAKKLMRVLSIILFLL